MLVQESHGVPVLHIAARLLPQLLHTQCRDSNGIDFLTSACSVHAAQAPPVGILQRRQLQAVIAELS